MMWFHQHPVYRFLVSDDGPTSVEYAVMLMMIAGAVLTMVELVGFQVADFWGQNASDVDQAINSNP